MAHAYAGAGGDQNSSPGSRSCRGAGGAAAGSIPTSTPGSSSASRSTPRHSWSERHPSNRSTSRSDSSRSDADVSPVRMWLRYCSKSAPSGSGSRRKKPVQMREVCLSNVWGVTRRPRGPHTGHRQSEPFRVLMFPSRDWRQDDRLRLDVPLARPICSWRHNEGLDNVRHGKMSTICINMFKLYVLHMLYILLTYVNSQHMLTHVNIYQHILMMPNICLHV
jgi:hypothetical protein